MGHRIDIICLLFTLASLSAGCANTEEARVRDRIAQSGLKPEANSARVAEIAHRLESAYGACSSLAFTAHVTEPPNNYKVRVELAMTPDKLKTKAFVDDVPIVIWTLIDGQFEECKLPYKGTAAQYSIRKAEQPDGPVDVTLSDGIERHMCCLGHYSSTWLAPTAHPTAFYSERIRGGVWVGTAQLDGLTCDVIACLPDQGHCTSTELFYVRPDGFLAKWESIRPTGSKIPRLMRIRTYVNYERNQVAPETWHFEKNKAA